MTKREEGEVVSGSTLTVIKEGSRPIITEVESLVSKTFTPYPTRIGETLGKDKLNTLISILFVFTMKGRLLSGLTCRYASPSIYISLCLASNCSGYTTRLPEFTQSTVPSENVRVERLPLGTINWLILWSSATSFSFCGVALFSCLSFLSLMWIFPFWSYCISIFLLFIEMYSLFANTNCTSLTTESGFMDWAIMNNSLFSLFLSQT